MTEQTLTPHMLIHWDEQNKKWIDHGNDFFCAKMWEGGWRVSARYGFSDGTSTKEFATEQEAMTFFVNYLFTRVQKLTEEGLARNAA